MLHAPQQDSGLRFLENLAHLVPGYHGYKHPGSRREVDARLRARVYRQIRQMLAVMVRLEQRWSHQAAEPLQAELGRRLAELRTLADSVRFAPGEQCHFFRQEAIAETALEKLLEADLLILADLEETAGHVALEPRISAAPRTGRAFLRRLQELLQRLEQHLIRRERVLSGG